MKRHERRFKTLALAFAALLTSFSLIGCHFHRHGNGYMMNSSVDEPVRYGSSYHHYY